MTFFITPEYFKTIVPLLVLLVGALISLKRPFIKPTLVLTALAMVLTWPSHPNEAFSRLWAHDNLLAAATVALCLVSLPRKPSLMLLFGGLVLAGANDVILMLLGAWLGLTRQGQIVLAVSVAAVLAITGSTELAAAQAAWFAPLLALAAWQSHAWEVRAGLIVAAARVIAVTLVPAEWAWRAGILR